VWLLHAELLEFDWALSDLPETHRAPISRGRSADQPGVVLCEPLGYLDFIGLIGEAKVVLTDSGGIQEETTVLGVSCLTLRESTERPVTVVEGTNKVIGSDTDRIVEETLSVLKGHPRPARIPELWDGHAADRIVARLRSDLSASGSGLLEDDGDSVEEGFLEQRQLRERP
jgi:UDP-N-acetylglucosamine 2-epimerase